MKPGRYQFTLRQLLLGTALFAFGLAVWPHEQKWFLMNWKQTNDAELRFLLGGTMMGEGLGLMVNWFWTGAIAGVFLAMAYLFFYGPPWILP